DGHRYEWNEGTGLILVFGGPENRKGSYLQDGPIQQSLDSVSRPAPLRLIVHNNGTTSRLMQRAYLGRDSSSNQVVATRQAALLASDLVNARRLSAVHLPTSDALGPWAFTGAMQEGASLVATIDLGYADPTSNPFVHTYHPDH